MKMLNLVGVALVVTLFVSWLSIAFYPSVQDFMRANPFWNGLRDFSERFQVKMMSSIDQATAYKGGGLLIVIPYTQYTNEELVHVAGFVTAGGSLLLMDDYGYGNQILSALKLDVEFSDEPLLDPYINYRNQWLPLATGLATELKEDGIERLTLNHATALKVHGKYEVLVSSSDTAYLDSNRNEAWDEGETRGSLPLAVRTTVGRGTVTVVSDPSILINSMVDREDNAAFLRYIVRQAGDNPWIALDISHLPNAPLDRSKSSWEMARERMAYPYSQLLLVGAALTVTLLPIWRKGVNIEQE